MYPQLIQIFGPSFFYTGLNKLASAKLATLGFERTDLRSCIAALGMNIYTKKAEYKKIIDGIQALNYLKKGC